MAAFPSQTSPVAAVEWLQASKAPGQNLVGKRFASSRTKKGKSTCLMHSQNVSRLIRFRRKREHFRFRDELRIIPKWIVVMCILLYILALIIGFSVNHYGFLAGPTDLYSPEMNLSATTRSFPISNSAASSPLALSPSPFCFSHSAMSIATPSAEA